MVEWLQRKEIRLNWSSVVSVHANYFKGKQYAFYSLVIRHEKLCKDEDMESSVRITLIRRFVTEILLCRRR